MDSFLLIAFAALLNAACDITENENFYSSIFRNTNERFFYKRVSWQYAKKIGGYKIDFWHLCKSGWIICLCLAMVLYQPVFGFWWDFIVGGAVWILAFNLSYNRIFKKKSK